MALDVRCDICNVQRALCELDSRMCDVTLLHRVQSEDVEKHELEDEAAESDNNFIDDDPDESDSDAAAMVQQEARALRNRTNWKENHTACWLCKDMRAVLRHLLGLH